MAEDGYEVMGPGGNAPKPATPVQVVPPPPPAIAQKSTQESAMESPSIQSKTKKKSGGKKNKDKSEIETDGTAVNQRPNSCDTLLLSVTCVVFIIVLAASIPIGLTAFGTLEIESIKNSLEGK